jgi:Uma2 family endonuclease
MFTSLRYEEAVNAYGLIIELSSEGRLKDYYNAYNDTLEHFRFRELFIRNSKKVFISFVSEEMVTEISQSQKQTYNSIQCKLKRRKMKLRFADLREYYASVMTKYLSQPEIDFYRGEFQQASLCGITLTQRG